MDEKAKISELYKDYWDYMVEKDIEGLRGLMSADYCLYHMTGVSQSADEFLQGLDNGTFNYYSADHDDIVVSVRGDEAREIHCLRSVWNSLGRLL